MTHYGKDKIVPRVCFIVLAVVLLVFPIYEAVERNYLAHLDMKTIHHLHIVRGVGSCIIVALLVGWSVLRSGPSIFPSEPIRGSHPREERHVHSLKWFIRMRWIACAVSAVLIISIIEVMGYLDKETFWPLVASVGCLAATNVIFGLLLRRGLFIQYLQRLQVCTDLVILTTMLHFGGGIENPLSFAYVFHVMISGILMSRRMCYATAIGASALFSIMAFAEMGDFLEHYTLRAFPHAEEAGGLLFHAAHQPVYVLSIVGVQLTIMSLTAYFITDIMGHLRAGERRAYDARQRLERVVQATGAGFAVLDKDLRPVWLNDKIKTWLHLPDSVIEQPSAVLEKWAGGKNSAAAKTFKDGRTRVVERHLVDARGGERFFQVTVAPVADAAGRIHQVLELTQDITRRKMGEAEKLHSAKMAVLGFMSAGVAHEVGNPLASISTRLYLLETNHDKAFLEESLRLLQRQISRIARIVRGISQFARPAKEVWGICRITLIVEEVLNMLRLHRPAKKSRIHVELAEDLPGTMGVKDQLTQVFLNLGLNALEAMPDGGTLTIRTYSVGDEIHIEFADTGEGVDKEVRTKMFDPFVSTKEDGLGIGLSIVHSIVLAHGGRVGVANDPGGGALFTVILPIRTPGEPPSNGKKGPSQ